MIGYLFFFTLSSADCSLALCFAMLQFHIFKIKREVGICYYCVIIPRLEESNLVKRLIYPFFVVFYYLVL